MNANNNSAITKDEFCQPSFINRNARIPTVIVLNHETQCGFFIPIQTMAKIGWVNFDENQLIEHTFTSGSKEDGILIKNPRMLCVPKTDLYQFDVDKSEKQKSKVVVGLYDPELKGNKNIKQERLYLVYFLDENNDFLHTLPLKYAGRGVNGATFESHRQDFRSELEFCHAIANGIPAKPKNDLFHALGVFSFKTKAEFAGKDKNRSWVCRVVEHDKPTINDWKNYFLGYDNRKDYVWESLEPDSEIVLPGLPQLAPAQTEHYQSVAALEDDDEILY